MTSSVIVHSADAQKSYQLVVAATGPTTAAVNERTWPLGGGSMSETNYNLTDVAVVGNILHAKAAAPMWQTADVEVELIVPDKVRLAVSGLRFGWGDIDEELTVPSADFAAIQDIFRTGGWPTS